VRAERIAFWIVTVLAAAVIWVPAYPPSIDLPQHAGQVRFLHDWWFSDFAWGRDLELNLFTPYLIGYALGALLALVMPAVAATKLVWSLAAFGTVYTAVRLRRLVGGDPRWDWLLVPGLFGMTFTWGFFSFFASIPFGLFALERWIIYLRAPSPRNALIVSGLLGGLFFAHVLTTIWVASIAGLMLLSGWRETRLPRLALRAVPLLVPLVLAYAWWEHLKTWGGPPGYTVWRVGAERLVDFFPQWLGLDSPIAIAVGVLLVATPFVTGARVSRDPIRLVPLAVTTLILMVVPYMLIGNAYTYNRFFTLLGPALVIALATPAAASRFAKLRAIVPVLVTVWTLLFAVRMALFRSESDDFARIVERMEPDRHVAGMVQQPGSEAAGLDLAYLHFPVWYQAATGGFTEFSFSTLTPTVVRFEKPFMSPIKRGFEFRPRLGAIDPKAFDYILVRGGDKDRPFKDGVLRLVAHEGTWWLYVPVR
jgi:hypothetical protein